MSEIIGPCYTPSALANALNLSHERIAELIDGLFLLQLTTADGETVYPAFQVRDGRIAQNLSPVLHALQSGIDDPWTWALWLQSKLAVFDGGPPRSRIEQLIDGEFDRVLLAAERSAHSWQS